MIAAPTVMDTSATRPPDDPPPLYKELTQPEPSQPSVNAQPSYATHFIMPSATTSPAIPTPTSEKSSSELVSTLLDTSRLLEKMAAVIPIAGSILQGIFGVTTLVLEKVDTSGKGDEQFKQLAIRSCQLAIDVNHHLAGRRVPLSVTMQTKLDSFLIVLREVLALFQKQANVPDRKRILKASKNQEKLNKLSRRLDELQLDFQLLASLESNAVLGTIRATGEASHAVMAEVHRHVLTLGETIRNQTATVDEDGLEIFTWKDIEIQTQLLRTLATPTSSVITSLAKNRKDKTVVIVKQWSTRNDGKGLKATFEEDSIIRREFRHESLLQLIGMVGKNGSAPAQVYHLPEADRLEPLMSWWQRMNQGNILEAALGAIELKWDDVRGVHGFTHLDSQNKWLDQLMVKVTNTPGFSKYSFIYAGELVTSVGSEDSLHRDDVKRPLQAVLPASSLLMRLLSRMNFDVPDSHGIDTSDAALTLSVLGNKLIGSDWLAPVHYEWDGVEVNLGDVGYKDPDGHFVMLRSAHDAMFELSDVRCWVEIGEEWFELDENTSLCIPQAKKRATIPITIHRIYKNRQPAMQFLLEETDALLRARRLPRNGTKLCVVTSQSLDTKLLYEVLPDETTSTARREQPLSLHLSLNPDAPILECLEASACFGRCRKARMGMGRRKVPPSVMFWDHKIKLLLGQPLDLVACASGLPVDMFPSLKKTPALPAPKVIRPDPTISTECIWVEVVKKALPITEYDESILQHVEDIEARQSFCCQQEEYTLVFRFAPDVEDYFEDKFLTLRYSRKNTNGQINSESDVIQWHPGCDPAGRVSDAAIDLNGASRFSSAALAHPSTSIFHLFVNPRSDPEFGNYICGGSDLANFAVEYVMQEQFLQVRKLFDVICDVQKSRTYAKEQTPIETGDKF